MGRLLIKSQKGSVAVEFGLVTFFILLPLVVGMIEFGFIFHHKALITKASREGARLLIMHSNHDGFDSAGFQQLIEDRVRAYCGDYGDGHAWSLLNPRNLDNPPTVTVTLSGVPVPGDDSGHSEKGDPFYVRVQYPYRFTFLAFMSRINPSFSGGITISAQTTMGYMEPDE